MKQIWKHYWSVWIDTIFFPFYTKIKKKKVKFQNFIFFFCSWCMVRWYSIKYNVLLNIREPHHQETILCFSRIRQILVFPLKLQPHTTHHPPPTTHHPLKQLICINKYRLILYGLMSFCGWFFIYLLGSRALNSRYENSYWWVVFILS